MLRRAVFILAALLCLIVGGAIVYLFMSIPNDLQAESLLTDARTDLQAKKRDSAREKLTKIVREYPRTDAAAAAAFALFRLADEENRELRRRMEELEKRQSDAVRKLNESSKKLDELAKPVPPPPPTAKVAPAKPSRPAARRPAATRTPQKRKPAPRRSTTRKRRAELVSPFESFHPKSDDMTIMSEPT